MSKARKGAKKTGATKRSAAAKKPAAKKPAAKKPAAKKPAAKKPAAKKPAAKKPAAKKPPAAKLVLANRRFPLESPTQLAAKERAQLELLLAEEGEGTIEEAAANEELSIELVDVVDGSGNVHYQLYVWPFGSGAMFEAGTTKLAANIIQHAFEPTGDDDGLAAVIAGAVAASVKQLELTQEISFDMNAEPKAVTGQQQQDRLWGTEWRPYPKRLLHELTAAQRKDLEARATSDRWNDQVKYAGLFPYVEHGRRYLGQTPAGPSDVTVEVDGRTVPIWWLASAVASGHADADEALAAFARVREAERLAAWTEIATGGAYDLLESHSLTFKEAGIPRTPSKVKYWTRLFTWLADAAVALGPAGRAAAEALLHDLPDRRSVARIYIGLLALARSPAGIDAKYDAVIRELPERKRRTYVYAEPVEKQILDSLPAPRKAELAPLFEK